MRTRTHYCFGTGCADFQKILSGVYPAGKIAFVGKRCDEMSSYASSLPDVYKLYLYTGSEIEKSALPDDIRMVIGFVSPNEISFLRKIAGDRKFAFLPTVFDFRYLYPFDKSEGLPEFVFLDRTVFSCENPAVCKQFFAQIFTFYCEGKIRLLSESHLPFTNKVLTGLTEECERLLSGKSDKENFLAEGARIIQVMSETFPHEQYLYTGYLADRYGLSPEKQFIVSYFLTVFLINFTSKPFNDILLNATEREVSYNPSVLPDKQKLKAFASGMKRIASLPNAYVDELLSLFSESASALPLLASLEKKGVFEGLTTYEKFARH